MATLSDELKAELTQVFIVGFLSSMAGTPVEDTDTILSEDAAPLILMAQGCINNGEDKIAAIYQENPGDAYQAVYDTGVHVAEVLNQVSGPEINLN